MMGVGHDDDEPGSSQQSFGNLSEFDDDRNDDHDVTTTPKGQDTTDIEESTDSGDDGQVRANGEASYRPVSSLGRPFPGCLCSTGGG